MRTLIDSPSLRTAVLSLALTAAACGQGKKPAEPPAAPAETAAPAAAAAAQDEASLIDQTVKDVAGPWDFSGIKGDPVCRLTLFPTQQSGALELQKSEDCDREFPVLSDATGWIVKGDGDISLTGKDRQIIMTLSQQEDGLYVSITPGEETYSLVNQDAGDFARTQPGAVIDGRWNVGTLGGQVLCAIDLKPAGDPPQTGAVTKASPCPEPSAINGAVSFQYSDEALSLRDSAGREVLGFTPGDSATWRATGEADGKLFMTR